MSLIFFSTSSTSHGTFMPSSAWPAAMVNQQENRHGESHFVDRSNFSCTLFRGGRYPEDHRTRPRTMDRILRLAASAGSLDWNRGAARRARTRIADGHRHPAVADAGG